MNQYDRLCHASPTPTHSTIKRNSEVIWKEICGQEPCLFRYVDYALRKAVGQMGSLQYTESTPPATLSGILGGYGANGSFSDIIAILVSS
jgi:hypothetical protein